MTNQYTHGRASAGGLRKASANGSRRAAIPEEMWPSATINIKTIEGFRFISLKSEKTPSQHRYAPWNCRESAKSNFGHTSELRVRARGLQESAAGSAPPAEAEAEETATERSRQQSEAARPAPRPAFAPQNQSTAHQKDRANRQRIHRHSPHRGSHPIPQDPVQCFVQRRRQPKSDGWRLSRK